MNDTFPMPDLSHLTEEERQNIMKVMQRHQAEEKRGAAVERNLTVLKEKHLSGAAPGKQTIPKPAPSVQKSMNTPPKESGTTDLCPICRKTQLARDCGHRCGFCKVLFCSRCGGKWQVKNETSSGMVWFCNSCRKKPPSSAAQRKINEQVIEGKSTRKHVTNAAETQTLPSPMKRPSLTRQDSESLEKQNFRIPKESHSLPRSGIGNHSNHSHADNPSVRKAKRSPPLGELDSGIASLSIEDGTNPLDTGTYHDKSAVESYPQDMSMSEESKSRTLPERSSTGKVRPRRRVLPRDPSQDNEGQLGFASGQKNHRSQHDSLGHNQSRITSTSKHSPGLRKRVVDNQYFAPNEGWFKRSFDMSDCVSDTSSYAGKRK